MLVEAFHNKPGNPASGDGLTQREEEILGFLAEGLSNTEIADRVKISYDIVRAHLRHIYEKLDRRGRTGAEKKYLTSPKAVTMKMRGDVRSPEHSSRQSSYVLAVQLNRFSPSDSPFEQYC